MNNTVQGSDAPSPLAPRRAREGSLVAASAGHIVRIGGASGFWGDSSIGAVQLVRSGQIDFLVFDYLAELTMSIMAAQRAKNPQAGFALDFVAITCRQVLKDCIAKNIRIISNAGGVNPQACAAALRALADEFGVSVKIAVVEGDDVMPQVDALRESGVREWLGMRSGARTIPEKLVTANAYLGAQPIAAALDSGAHVVITGRCVDSAVTLGALLHEYKWAIDDFDKLAQASLAGHIIECGAQATGGLFTDWRDVPGWANIGYPIVEVSANASFVVTKPPKTGGLVSPAVVAEQILYEIADPRGYVLPDVVCDFADVCLETNGEHRVRVSGARGSAPPSHLKVSATEHQGFRCVAQLAIIGFDAAAKARRTGEALLERTRGMFQLLGLPDYHATSIEILGAENALGPHASVNQGAPGDARPALREAILRLVVRHPVKAALELFAREIAAPGTSFSPGTTGMDGGRPSVAPSLVQFQFLLPREAIDARVWIDGDPVAFTPTTIATQAIDAVPRRELHEPPAIDLSDSLEVPLIEIAHARSGDKGNTSNIGLIARKPEYLPLIAAQVTPEAVKAHLAHFVEGEVHRYTLPGLNAFNYVCEQALGGGGMASLRHDPLGKGMGQLLLMMKVRVPRAMRSA